MFADLILKTLIQDKTSSTSYGKFNDHSEMWWRAFINVSYSLGFVEREVHSLIKKNGNYAIQALFRICSY